MDDLTTGSHFQVTIPGAAESADELGLWQVPTFEKDIDPSGESFALPPGQQAIDQERVSLWRVDLPEDPLLAQVISKEQVARLENAERALPDGSRRLQEFVRQSVVQGPESFAVGAGVGGRLARPERELAALISVTGLEASFGVSDKNWEELSHQAAIFFERVRRSLLYLAWVESASGGHRYGMTIVSWNGHFHTACGPNMRTTGVEQHAGNIDLVLRTRANWLRMALLILRGSLQLGVLFPTNPLLAVPAAWRFFKQVLELSQELVPQPIG